MLQIIEMILVIMFLIKWTVNLAIHVWVSLI